MVTSLTVLASEISKSDFIGFVTEFKDHNNLLEALDCQQSDIIVITTDLSARSANKLKIPRGKIGILQKGKSGGLNINAITSPTENATSDEKIKNQKRQRKIQKRL